MFDFFGSSNDSAYAREKQELYDVQDGRCMYCAERMRMSGFEIDHRTPRAKGGSDSMRNKQLLCRDCNRRKGAMTDGAFRRKYNLPTISEAGGYPPTRTIRQSDFDDRTEEFAHYRKTRKKWRKKKKSWLARLLE